MECSVCLLPYDTKERRPKSLPKCGHTFCVACLNSISGDDSGRIQCPVCRKYVTNHNGSALSVDTLLDNFAVLQIIESSPRVFWCEQCVAEVSVSSKCANEHSIISLKTHRRNLKGALLGQLKKVEVNCKRRVDEGQALKEKMNIWLKHREEDIAHLREARAKFEEALEGPLEAFQLVTQATYDAMHAVSSSKQAGQPLPKVQRFDDKTTTIMVVGLGTGVTLRGTGTGKQVQQALFAAQLMLDGNLEAEVVQKVL